MRRYMLHRILITFLTYEIYFSGKICFYFNNTMIYILCVGLMNKYNNENIKLKIELDV